MMKFLIPMLVVVILSSCGNAHAQLQVRVCVDGPDIDAHNPLPLYEPCYHDNHRDIQLNYGETIDFADYSTKIQYDPALPQGGIPKFKGWVWIKVQGKYYLIPYYKSPMLSEPNFREDLR